MSIPVLFLLLYFSSFVRYPRFTLMGQSLGSMLLGLEALNCLVPHVFIGTKYSTFLIHSEKTRWVMHSPTLSSNGLEVVTWLAMFITPQ